MSESINWIHLTDLHLGLDSGSWLWPRVKHDLLRDLEKLGQEVDYWDLVFFTGDLVQRGDAAEFERLNQELREIWDVLSRKGSPPKLCVIPGNHDLLRPPEGSAVGKTFNRLWWTDSDLRRSFWREPSGEYRTSVNAFFANYTDWCSRISVPILSAARGILPGDSAGTFSKGAVSLAIVGLNSTFLQVTRGDYRGRLDLHVSQLSALCDGDPVRWLRGHTTALLLTHHPPSWLAPEALEHFRQEIYPPGRFMAQLCGHQHEPEAFEFAEAGAAPRRLRQGPSLFGLEQYSGAEPTKRIHGYTAGQFVFDDTGGFETRWPRTAVKGRHGGLILCPDHSFQLNDENAIVIPFDLDGDPQPTGHPTLSGENAPDPTPADTRTPELTLLDNALDPRTASGRLAVCPRIGMTFGPQHISVRQEEQNQFELALRRTRSVWLVADWGSGKDGFLAAALHRFQHEESPVSAFHLRCDDASDVDSVESAFTQQFGMTLQAFCNLVAPLKNTFLVFDEIHPELCSGEPGQGFLRIARAVLDYCPSLSVVAISRLMPVEGFSHTVSLHPLDVPDVRTYIMHHPETTAELHEAEVIEKLYERSDGLPMHLDRMLRALKVASLTSVLDSGSDFDPQPAQKSTPRALVHTVSTLSKSRDKGSRRSFRLLKVLAVLPYGETLDTLRHYLPTEPFFYENALQLNELALLDVILLQQARVDIATVAEIAATDTPKVLRVPRQVRDYVQTLLPDDERAIFLLAGMERFFGTRWTEGHIKARTVPAEYRAYLSSGVGNEFAVVSQFLHLKSGQSDDGLFRRVLDVGVKYARYMQQQDRYRDVVVIARGLIPSVDRDKVGDVWCELAVLLGEGLRMMGKAAEALTYFKQAVEVGRDLMTSDDKADLWIKVAYAEKTLQNKDAAVTAAEAARQHSKPKRVAYLQSAFISALLTLVGENRSSALRKLERSARDAKMISLAENIALSLAEDASLSEKVELLDRVLKGRTQGYNQVRAIVSKAEAIQKVGPTGALRESDLQILTKAYSYLHTQRLGSLFDKCHLALWAAFEAKGDTLHMLRLFRHSSFLWRIRGDETKESTFVKRLVERDVAQHALAGLSNADLAIRYFWLRTRSLGALPQPSTREGD
jgi:3',5'-cyclic AMP phosphodiesterase CpdA